ncbi:hypothetical protein [Frankia sp. R82]|uniref:hypothetical protein n=1 Tax=Frankia sp. R82 TaxID=2950553 RepID=UPI00204306F3|nr:hypothetical protein [Frankia sp. R82]MCM3884995.1 hypothetical protein [Frankia sp. R82]
MKLSWRRHREHVTVNPSRTLTGPARAAALGVADETEPEPTVTTPGAGVGATVLAAAPSAAAGPGSPSGAAAPTGSRPVMLTLTTRAHVEQAEQEAAASAAQPVRRRMERGMFGGDAPTGGGCSSGGCG